MCLYSKSSEVSEPRGRFDRDLRLTDRNGRSQTRKMTNRSKKTGTVSGRGRWPRRVDGVTVDPNRPETFRSDRTENGSSLRRSNLFT